MPAAAHAMAAPYACDGGCWTRNGGCCTPDGRTLRTRWPDPLHPFPHRNACDGRCLRRDASCSTRNGRTLLTRSPCGRHQVHVRNAPVCRAYVRHPPFLCAAAPRVCAVPTLPVRGGAARKRGTHSSDAWRRRAYAHRQRSYANRNRRGSTRSVDCGGLPPLLHSHESIVRRTA